MAEGQSYVHQKIIHGPKKFLPDTIHYQTLVFKDKLVADATDAIPPADYGTECTV